VNQCTGESGDKAINNTNLKAKEGRRSLRETSKKVAWQVEPSLGSEPLS
jgi:hypothetical protein